MAACVVLQAVGKSSQIFFRNSYLGKTQKLSDHGPQFDFCRCTPRITLRDKWNHFTAQ